MEDELKAFYAKLAPLWPGLVARNPIGPKAVAAAVQFQKADLATLMREAEALAKPKG